VQWLNLAQIGDLKRQNLDNLQTKKHWHIRCLCQHVSSFIRSIRGGGRLLAVFRHVSSHRQRWGLGLAQCASPLTLGLVLYIYRAQLKPASFYGKVPKCGPPIGPLAPAICYPHRRLSPYPDAPNPGVMACHICKRTQANPLYLPENLIS